MLKPRPPHKYNRCSEQPPSTSWQTVFSRTHLKVLASAVVTSCHEIFDSPGRDCINVLLQVSPQEKIYQSDPATEEAMQSALHFQSTSLSISCSTTAGHLPHCALELHCAETTTSALQLEAQLQAVPIEKFPDNNYIVDSQPVR